MNADDVTLVLSKDEALVLFEWIHALKETKRSPLEGSAEERVTWALEGLLEKTLAEPFRADYLRLVEDARMRLVSDVES